MKKLLTVLFPVVLAIACSFAVWANEPTAAKPACDKCPKAAQAAAANKDAAVECPKAAQMKGGKPCEGKGCDKQAMAAGCANCPKMKGAAGKPCGQKGCDKGAQLQQPEAKPCCDKAKKL